MKVVIIIPVLNEESLLTGADEYYRQLASVANICFVDGGSHDRTIALAKQFGQVIVSSPGRGVQKNSGAEAVSADVFFFAHVDTQLPFDIIMILNQAIAEGKQAGCLTLNIRDAKGVFRYYEWMVNRRARYGGIMDGDLGFFIRKDVFRSINGFPTWRVMEDIEISRRLKKHHITCHQLTSLIAVSARQWHQQGFWKTFWLYSCYYIQWWFGKNFVVNEKDSNVR